MWLFLYTKQSQDKYTPFIPFVLSSLINKYFWAQEMYQACWELLGLQWWIKREPGSASTELRIHWKSPRRKQKITSIINDKIAESRGAMKPHWRDTQDQEKIFRWKDKKTEPKGGNKSAGTVNSHGVGGVS